MVDDGETGVVGAVVVAAFDEVLELVAGVEAGHVVARGGSRAAADSSGPVDHAVVFFATSAGGGGDFLGDDAFDGFEVGEVDREGGKDGVVVAAIDLVADEDGGGFDGGGAARESFEFEFGAVSGELFVGHALF